MSALVFALFTHAADQKTELTLDEFRASVREQSASEKSQPDLHRADGIFLRLLSAQGGEAASRQSLDRLSGWYKAAQARVQAQNAPPLDVDLLRFAEGRAAARVARYEANRRRAIQEANLLLNRPPNSPLVALIKPSPSPPENKPETSAATSVPTQDVSPDLASREAQFEKELLPSANELLGKMYQSYLFGGTPLTSLLWQEQQVYETELQYRQLLVQAERQRTPG